MECKYVMQDLGLLKSLWKRLQKTMIPYAKVVLWQIIRPTCWKYPMNTIILCSYSYRETVSIGM